MAAAAIRSDSRLAAAALCVRAPGFRAAVATAATKVAKFAAEFAPIYAHALSELTKLAQQLAPVLSAPRAVEYENLLLEIGYGPAQARFLANWAIKAGGQYAADVTACRRRFGAAMRRITKAKSALAIAGRARDLVPELDNWAKLWIEDGLRKAHSPLSVQEFHALVQQAADQEAEPCALLQQVAHRMFPYLPKARGKALSAVTMTHAMILMFAHDRGHPEGYTYSELEGGHIDKMTAASVRQFGLERFNPTSSRQLLKSLKLTEG
jgi:nicotinamide riboside kinase